MSTVASPDPESGALNLAATAQLVIREPKLLLVEGREEARFWRRFLALRGKGGYQVLSYDGRYNFRNSIKLFRQTPDFDQVRWLGVMRDADDNARGAFESIGNSLQRAGLARPRRPWSPKGGAPDVTIFIMPDGTSQGAFEDLLLSALKSSPATSCVERYFDCLAAAGVGQPTHPAKSRVHAYLSSLPRGELRLVEALNAGHLEMIVGSAVFEGLFRLLP